MEFVHSTLAGAVLLALSWPLVSTYAADGHADVADNRHALQLDAREKALLLSEMRQFLGVTQRILEASLADDMNSVAEAARSVGLAAHRGDFADASSIVHGVRKKAPKEFFPLGRATHEAFDEIADVAEQIQDRELVQRRLAESLGRCVACHATYRISDAQ